MNRWCAHWRRGWGVPLLVLAALGGPAGCRDRASSTEGSASQGRPAAAPTAAASQVSAAVPSAQPAAEPGAKATVLVGASLPVRATHRLGVPLHPGLRDDGVSGRVSDGSHVTVLEHDAERRWFKVRDATGQVGWIVRRYLPSLDAPAHRGESEALSAASPWRSPEACRRALRQRTAARSARHSARLGSWNIAWFPDGRPGKQPARTGTDLDWLACAIALLDVDALALQELKTLPRARAAMERVIAVLNRYTTGDWRLQVDTCPMPAQQHNGILYDAKRVRATNFSTYADLNPHGAACDKLLRPGFGAYLEFRGGLDLHFVSVHQKSGNRRRDYDLRQTALQGIAGAVKVARAGRPDSDFVVAGDFNTMGCGKCAEPITASDEIEAVDAMLGDLVPPLRRVASVPPCSQYYRGNGGLLDLFVVSRSFAELPRDASVEVGGVCGELGCAPAGTPVPRALEALSDHCPIVLEVVDRDADE